MNGDYYNSRYWVKNNLIQICWLHDDGCSNRESLFRLRRETGEANVEWHSELKCTNRRPLHQRWSLVWFGTWPEGENPTKGKKLLEVKTKESVLEWSPRGDPYVSSQCRSGFYTYYAAYIKFPEKLEWARKLLFGAKIKSKFEHYLSGLRNSIVTPPLVLKNFGRSLNCCPWVNSRWAPKSVVVL